MAQWWLSYADEEGFRGVCIVVADDFLGACAKAKRLGISPGGQVRGTEIANPEEPKRRGYKTNRLYSLAELQAMDEEIIKWSDADKEREN